MVLTWIFPAVGAAFVTAWSYHNSKFIGLPKLDRKYGIPTAVGLVLLTWWLYKHEHMHVGHIPRIPRIHTEAEAGYAHNPAITTWQPIGQYTGPGLTDDLNKPESSILPFPDNVARQQSKL